MEIGARLYQARIDIEKEFLCKYENSVYTKKLPLHEMQMTLRTLKVNLVSGDTYCIDEYMGDKDVEAGLYATCYPMLNKLFIFTKMIENLSMEALRVLFRHEFLHVIQVKVLHMYEESYFEPHAEAFIAIAREMGYEEWIASGSIELTNIK